LVFSFYHYTNKHRVLKSNRRTIPRASNKHASFDLPSKIHLLPTPKQSPPQRPHSVLICTSLKKTRFYSAKHILSTKGPLKIET